MNKKRWIILFLLLAAGLLTAAFFLIPPTPATLKAITVTDLHLGSGESYTLDEHEARRLIAALRGADISEPGGIIETAFELVLHLKTSLSIRYTVYVTSNREIYLQRQGEGRFVHVENGDFFYVHEAFQSIYRYSTMPSVQIIVREEEIAHQIQSRWWQFMGLEGRWRDGWIPPLPSSADPAERAAEIPALRYTENDFTLIVEPAPERASLAVTDPAGATVYEGPFDTHEGRLPPFPRNGLYDCLLSLFWEEENLQYRGGYEASFAIRVELPPEFIIPEAITQGEMAVFYFRNLPTGSKPVLELNMDFKPQFFPLEDGYVAYLPTHYGTAAGEYRLAYGAEGEALEEGVLVILPRQFHIQYLSVDPSIEAATRNDEAYAQFARYFPKSRETSADERYYSEPFIIPVSGRLTTEFGQTRYVNNAPTSSRHSGLDIAAPTGTPVRAVNSGRVTLSMELILTGNTVVIDHGQGLFSVYYHMHGLQVEEGDIVERGQQVGTVGSTGFSTGPHLHLIISYYQFNLEPGYFLVGEPITLENYMQHLSGR